MNNSTADKERRQLTEQANGKQRAIDEGGPRPPTKCRADERAYGRPADSLRDATHSKSNLKTNNDDLQHRQQRQHNAASNIQM